MDAVVTVQHGSKEDISRSVDFFAQFYQEVFREKMLQAYVSRQRKRYGLVLAIVLFLLVVSVIPALINLSSIFAILLLIMGVALFGGCIYLGFKLLHAKEDGEKNLPKFFEEQFRFAKQHSVYETMFTPNSLIILSGDPKKKTARKTREYKDIPRVYETNDIFFFEGMGWVPKEVLRAEEQIALEKIIYDNFTKDQYNKVKLTQV
jgi:hypothetical protein